MTNYKLITRDQANRQTHICSENEHLTCLFDKEKKTMEKTKHEGTFPIHRENRVEKCNALRSHKIT